MKRRHKIIIRLLYIIILMLGQDLSEKIKKDLDYIMAEINISMKEEE